MTGLNVFMTADAVGGVWQYATDLCAHLADHGHRVTLAVLGPPPDVQQRAMVANIAGLRLLETGLPLDWLAPDRATVEQAAHQLCDLMLREGCDIVHCNHPALAGAARFPLPTLAVGHGCVATWWRAVRGKPLPAAMAWHSDLIRAGLRHADAAAAPSASFANMLKECYQLPHRPTVIHNGRTPGAAQRGEVRSLNAALTVGRHWDVAKNTRLLDRVARSTSLPFLAAGALRGPNGEAISFSHMQALGQIGPGRLTELLSMRPIFVSAALFEPFGLAVLEAASAGCALVLSDIPTFRELWGGAALFVDPHDAPAFSAVINGLAQTPARRRQLGRAAAERAADFTPHAAAVAVDSLYRQIAAPQKAVA